ncbi:MAG TPA: VTT domain-containing protein [Gammaproteobacteria bacterium]
MSRVSGRTESWGPRIRLGLIIASVVVALVLFAGSKHWLSIDALRNHRDALLHLVEGRYWQVAFIMAGLTITLVGMSMPVTPILMLLSGLFFNRWIGSTLMLVSLALGATLALLVVRYLAQDFVRARVQDFPRTRRLLSSFGQHQSSYLLFLRFAPGIPFWLTNILYGLTEISALRFLLLTLVGLIPSVVIYCNIGANLAHVKSVHELLSPGIIGGLALLAALCLLPVAVQRWRHRA